MPINTGMQRSELLPEVWQHINRKIIYERKCFLASRLPTNFKKSL